VREEADSLADALAARKAIEQAKGLLMAKEQLTEQAASTAAPRQSGVRQAAEGDRGRGDRYARRAMTQTLTPPRTRRRSTPAAARAERGAWSS
jgi:Response regulator with putative antiterminator output domain